MIDLSKPFRAKVLRGDCVEVMKALPADSIDAVVCDPPYGLSFMGKEWDSFGTEIPAGIAHSENAYGEGQSGVNFKAGATGKAHSHGLAGHDGKVFQAWCETWAKEALRVLKPGGHLLAFGGTRTYHRLTCAIEDAGFEIRDSIHWTYLSGFPKSLNLGKAIDKAAGAERAIIGPSQRHAGTSSGEAAVPDLARYAGAGNVLTAPATDAAKQWDGWGTALKPSHEPIVLARKPCSEKTVAANVLKYGTGALNIDGTRVATAGGEEVTNHARGEDSAKSKGIYGDSEAQETHQTAGQALGRWPPNTLFSHGQGCVRTGTVVVKGDNRTPDYSHREPGFYNVGEVKSDGIPRGSLHGDQEVAVYDCEPGCPVAEWDRQSGVSKSSAGTQKFKRAETSGWKERGGSYIPGREWEAQGHGDSGGASRMFPTFDWSAEQEDPVLGLAGLSELKAPFHYFPKPSTKEREAGCGELKSASGGSRGNTHPTLKSLALMKWLIALVTPPGGIVLDPFAGSGSTGCAAVLEGFRPVLIERESEYVEIIKARITYWSAKAKESENALTKVAK